MQGERTIERNGEKLRERIAASRNRRQSARSSERGHLCARAHAALQSLYNPDRLRGPMQRTGPRGNAQFKTVSWDAALTIVAEKASAVPASRPDQLSF